MRPPDAYLYKSAAEKERIQKEMEKIHREQAARVIFERVDKDTFGIDLAKIGDE